MSEEAKGKFSVSRMKIAVSRDAPVSEILEKIDRRCNGMTAGFGLFMESKKMFCDPSQLFTNYFHVRSVGNL